MKIFEKLKKIFRKPKPPEEKKEVAQPEPILEASASLAQVGFSAEAATYALRRFAEALRPKLRSNNWRKMHGLPMRRKMPKQRRR